MLHLGFALDEIAPSNPQLPLVRRVDDSCCGTLLLLAPSTFQFSKSELEPNCKRYAEHFRQNCRTAAPATGQIDDRYRTAFNIIGPNVSSAPCFSKSKAANGERMMIFSQQLSVRTPGRVDALQAHNCYRSVCVNGIPIKLVK